MDEQDYINNPNYCPVCKSDDFCQADSAYDSRYYWLYLCCNVCESQWTEEYVLDKMWITSSSQDLDADKLVF